MEKSILKNLKEAIEITLEAAEDELREENKNFFKIKKSYLEGKIQGIRRCKMLIETALKGLKI